MMNDQPHPPQDQQQNGHMSFGQSSGASVSSAGSNSYSQEQLDALKRHHVQAQAARNNNNSTPPVPSMGSQAGNGSVNNNSTGGTQQQGPYMVLTQVAVPAHMLGHLTKNNQLQQLLQQQQQQGKGSQPQILSFNQLPPHVQQQILLQQQQLQGQSQTPQQQQQQQAWQLAQQQSQQQQQQGSGTQGGLTVANLQALMKNNQLDANLMQQILAGQMSKTGNSNSANSQQESNPNGDHRLSDLFSSFNDQTSDKDSNSDFSNTNKRLFLETQVQPVHRQLDSYSDDDLFKFFDMEMGEDGSGVEDLFSSTMKQGEMVSQMESQSLWGLERLALALMSSFSSCFGAGSQL